MTERYVTGAAMLRATTLDPQMRAPVRPRLLNDLAFVSTGNGLLVEGTETRQLFRGPAVDSLDIIGFN